MTIVARSRRLSVSLDGAQYPMTLNSLTAGCNQKKLEVQRVLEFFGQEAVAKVVRESPKLVEPGAAP